MSQVSPRKFPNDYPWFHREILSNLPNQRMQFQSSQSNHYQFVRHYHSHGHDSPKRTDDYHLSLKWSLNSDLVFQLVGRHPLVLLWCDQAILSEGGHRQYQLHLVLVWLFNDRS
ncbi:hypothetical protein WR25_10226 [Diploscapter pachys]|uniref:Uncharacterized protein n=1 Tax=Diploscapter pachys TaxID=2018661 RepID=A0A2A2L5X5_9BILA|nr:hypothetical protein WR25_10226 [Diploscapter pachys]